MKNLTKKICVFIVLSSVSLFSQENSALQVHHVGVDNHYKIGTAENPVTANEYCAFLNSEPTAQNQNYQYAHFFYEDSFMNSTYACGNRADWSYHFPMTIEWGHHSTIQENDCITRLNEYTCHYVVIPERGNYIIDGLTKRSGYKSNDSIVFTTFNKWRKNPMTQEICDYLNDKMGGRDNDAEAIKNKYLLDADSISKLSKAAQLVVQSQNINITSTFNWLDTLAIAAHDDQSLYASFKMIDEKSRPFITFSMQSDDPKNVNEKFYFAEISANFLG